MATKKKKTALSTIVTVLIVVAVIWMKYDETRDAQRREGGIRDSDVEMLFPDSPSDRHEVATRLVPVRLSSGKFDILQGCTLIDHRGNDGDSFHVMTPNGHKEFRLYYVDAPESAARTYGPGEDNYKRIAQQGRAMGGLNRKETTQVGVEAKIFVGKLLKGRKFRVVTNWENVYDARRQYAFVLVPWEGQTRYLHELLIAHGLARIYTKPAPLPDNTPAIRHKKQLRELEQYAQKRHYGAWGVR
jgi:endonuclease YncB( thermonuclease family)